MLMLQFISYVNDIRYYLYKLNTAIITTYYILLTSLYTKIYYKMV